MTAATPKPSPLTIGRFAIDYHADPTDPAGGSWRLVETGPDGSDFEAEEWFDSFEEAEAEARDREKTARVQELGDAIADALCDFEDVERLEAVLALLKAKASD